MLAPILVDEPEPVVDKSSQVLNLRRATVHALLLAAVARNALGDPRAAEASIERALELAERDGMILQFMLVPVRELLERHPRHRTAHATLLSTILDVLAGASPPPSDETTPLPELFVSPNTVRTHLRHIYAKLDAHSRGEAVARARALRLLAPGARAR